ncbi:MAG: ABC transporter substrate-binding protein [Firmicutes bacterium]|nr:ABC transporter substrate-binding protein [Bacillota bacterium]
MVLILLLASAVTAGCRSGKPAAEPAKQPAAQQPAPQPAAKDSQAPAKPAAETQPLKIGLVSGLSNWPAVFGVPAMEGFQFAADEINSAGGVLGRKLEMVKIDDEGSPFNSQQAIVKFYEQGIRFVMSGSHSTAVLAQKPKVEELKMLVISPLATDPAVTDTKDPYYFVDMVNNIYLGGSIGFYARKNLNLNTVLTFVRDDAYGTSINKAFEEKFVGDGGRVLAKVTYPTDAKDFRADLSKHLGAKPDAIMLTGFAPESGLIAGQARELGFQGTILATNPVLAPQYAEAAKAGAENTWASGAFSLDPNAMTDATKDYLAKWKAKFGKEPNVYQAHAYDAVYLLKKAIEDAKSTDLEPVRKAMLGIKNFNGASGVTTVAPDGSTQKPVRMMQYKDGGWKYITSLEPGKF